MVYRAKNLAMDKPTFIAKVQVYFFRVPYSLNSICFKNTKEINLESLRVMNVGLDKSNFSRDMVSCQKFGDG